MRIRFCVTPEIWDILTQWEQSARIPKRIIGQYILRFHPVEELEENRYYPLGRMIHLKVKAKSQSFDLASIKNFIDNRPQGLTDEDIRKIYAI